MSVAPSVCVLVALGVGVCIVAGFEAPVPSMEAPTVSPTDGGKVAVTDCRLVGSVDD